MTSSSCLPRIRYGLWLALTAVLLAKPAIAEVPINGLTDAEKRSGWRLIFDGKTKQGWRNYRKDSVGEGWQVQDGALTRASRGAGDIISSEQFQDFELSLEFKISKGGNSGVMFHVAETAKPPWHTGPEVQIQDNKDGHDPQLAGWLYQLYKPNKPAWVTKFEKEVGIDSPPVVDATRPAGQWNHLYLRIDTKGQCEVALNGVSYYKFQLGSDDWNNRVAKSKFAKFEQFGKTGKGHICLQDHGNLVAYRSIKVRTLGENGSIKNPIDKALPVTSELAFADVNWAGWDRGEETGKVRPLRPMVMAHAGEGDPRLFIAMQDGGVHVIPRDDKAKASKMFLDLRGKVRHWSKSNEEGLLGFAFHPHYQKNGQFFVYYSREVEPRASIVSKFRVSKDDPDRADPDSEEIVIEIPQPFGNHNGGSIDFGPDGYLYIGLGDGGSRNDPMGNGQNLTTLLGSILRIDVDKKSDGQNYSIPAENPFTDLKAAAPEIYAFGFRNPWRISFDRKTGDLWVADVGQDLWEEINVVTAGGNYGWAAREGAYGFGNDAKKSRFAPIEPVWEYDHQIGKSITGGYVYRGKAIPELQGAYVYADYVSGRIWALKYDHEGKKVVANYGLREEGLPVLAFGEDHDGELYYFVADPNGRCIRRFAKE